MFPLYFVKTSFKCVNADGIVGTHINFKFSAIYIFQKWLYNFFNYKAVICTNKMT